MNQIKILFLIIVISSLTSCKQNNVEGIQIDDTLYTHQSYSENKEFCKLIKETLNKNEASLKSLTDWDCGGGAGCYDLGFVIIQVIYRMGESDFIEICRHLKSNEKLQLEVLIQAGLEYGYDTPLSFNKEFPNLEKELGK